MGLLEITPRGWEAMDGHWRALAEANSLERRQSERVPAGTDAAWTQDWRWEMPSQ